MKSNICVLVSVIKYGTRTPVHYPLILDPGTLRFQLYPAIEDYSGYEGIWLSMLPGDHEYSKVTNVVEIEMPIIVTEPT